MIYKSLKEEWPLEHECVWLRWTEDGVNYREEVVNECNLMNVESINIPEWRPIEPPEWLMEEADRQRVFRERQREFEGISDDCNF